MVLIGLPWIFLRCAYFPFLYILSQPSANQLPFTLTCCDSHKLIFLSLIYSPSGSQNDPYKEFTSSFSTILLKSWTFSLEQILKVLTKAWEVLHDLAPPTFSSSWGFSENWTLPQRCFTLSYNRVCTPVISNKKYLIKESLNILFPFVLLLILAQLSELDLSAMSSRSFQYS